MQPITSDQEDPAVVPEALTAQAPFALRRVEVQPLASETGRVHDLLTTLCEDLEAASPTHGIYSGRGEVDHAQLLMCLQSKLMALGNAYRETPGVSVQSDKPVIIAHAVNPQNPREWIPYTSGGLGYAVTIGETTEHFSIHFERTGNDE